MTTPAGWYDDGSGRLRWWDGTEWTERFRDPEPVAEDPLVGEQPELAFDAEIDGSSARVAVFADRLEWTRVSGGVSAGKITAGILTAGMSLAVTGVGQGGYRSTRSTELSVLYLNGVTGVSSERSGRGTAVTITTPTKSLTMCLPRRDAEQVTRRLDALVRAAGVKAPHPSPIGSEGAAAAQIQAISDPATARALLNLQNLLYSRTISEEEFRAAKDRLFNTQ